MLISKSKRHPLITALAVASSLLLVTGQAFGCCHINESLVSGVEDWLAKDAVHAAENHAHSADTDSDAHCHAEVEAKQHCEGVSFAPQDHCISGSGLSAKSMMASESHTFIHFPSIAVVDAKFVLPASVQFEKPRPQNKSSPPVYLTTRHLVV